MEEEAIPQSRQHYAVFTVELLLDEANTPRRTRVMHVQSQQESTWAGWDDRRLVMYFLEKAELNLPLSEAFSPKPESEFGALRSALEGGARPRAINMGVVDIAGQLYLKIIGVVPTGLDRNTMVISRDQPYNIHLNLDLSQVEAPHAIHINYAVTVYSKSLSDGVKRTIGVAQGSIVKSDEVSIMITGSPLSAGTYRLEAIAMVSPPSGNAKEHPNLIAMLEGQIIKVY